MYVCMVGKWLSGAHRSNSAAHTAKTQPHTQIQLSHAHKSNSAAHTDTTHLRTQIQLICAHKMDSAIHTHRPQPHTNQSDISSKGSGGGGGVGCNNVPCTSLSLTCSFGRVEVGSGGVGCNNVPCTSLPLTCSPGRVGVGWGGVGWGGARAFLAHHFHLLHPRLGQHGGVGVGWGGLSCNNVLAQCARIGRSLGIHFHLLAHCIHVLVSMGGWGWGGVGWVAIVYLRSAHGLGAHLVSTSTDTCSLHPRLGQHGGVGVGWGAMQ